MGLEKYVNSVRDFVKEKSREIGYTTLTAAALFGYSLLYSPSVRAGDVLTTNDISIGDVDTDGDGFNDRIDPSPTDPDTPDFGSGNWLYDFSYIQNLTTGTTKNALSPAWHLGGQRVSYIESDLSFANGTLYSKNIFDLTRARRELETGLNAELRNITTGPLGLIDYFHKPRPIGGLDGIFKVGVGGFFPSSRAVPGPTQTLPEDVNLRNPSVGATLSINISGATIEAVSEWLLAETDLPSATSGQIYAFKINPSNGNWDNTVSPVQVTNFTNRTAIPKVSRDLDNILFQSIDGNKNYLIVANSLQDILGGVDTPYLFGVGDPRINIVSTNSEGVAFPGGFGARGNLFYFVQDVNNVYSLNDLLNFSGDDFNICIRGTSSGNVIRIPLPGNQITPAVSHDGMRLAFADDYFSDGALGGNFNLYATGIKPLGKIIDGLEADMLNDFTAPSGLVFEGNRHRQIIRTPGGTGNVLSMYSPLKPVADATSALSALTALTRYGPDGLEVEDPAPVIGEEIGVYQTKPWTIEDLVTEDGSLLDENNISIGWEVEDATTGNPVYTTLPEQYILDRDLVNREIRFIAPGFSTAKKKKYLKGLPLPTGSASYGLIAPKLIPEPPSSVDNALLYE